MNNDHIIYNKIAKALELICPLYKSNLITDAYIVGSIAKGTAREESDIDIYIINPDFKKQNKYGYDIQLVPDIGENIYTNKIIYLLKTIGVEFKYLSIKHDILWLEIYKDEIFHFMYNYESEPIKSSGEYIQISKELCSMKE